MEKKVLSIEQALHLRKDLGFDMSDATLVFIYKDYDEENFFDWEDITMVDGKPYFFDCGDEYELHGELYDAEYGNYDHSYREYCAVYTLQEVLDRLPLEVCGKDGHRYELFIDYGHSTVSYYNWVTHEVYMDIQADSKEIIDSAYEMLCRVIKDGYLKTK